MPPDANPGRLLELPGAYWQTCARHAAVKRDLFTTPRRERTPTVIIKTAEVSARGERYCGIVRLTLTREPDGWTYRVEDVRDENFTLTWRARTPEGATRKLRDVYDPDVWHLAVKETG